MGLMSERWLSHYLETLTTDWEGRLAGQHEGELAGRWTPRELGGRETPRELSGLDSLDVNMKK